MKLIEVSVPRLAVGAFPPAGLESGGLDKGQGRRTALEAPALSGLAHDLQGQLSGSLRRRSSPWKLLHFLFI
jgi:hypothetical protein